MNTRDDNFFKFFPYFVFFLVFIPYGNEGYYKISNLAIASLLFFIVTLCLFYSGLKVRISKSMQPFFLLLITSLIFQVFVDFYVLAFTDIRLYSSDLSELIRVYQVAAPAFVFTFLYGVASDKKRLFSKIIKATLILSMAHLFLSVVPKLTNIFDDLVAIYGEGEVYSAGYARYRALGIIGQPGKAGMFCVLATMIAMLHYRIVGKNHRVVYLIIIISFVSSLLTLSRTSTIFITFVIFLFSKGLGSKVILSLVGVVSTAYVASLNEEFYDMFFRGIDFASGEYSTASHRMVLKAWALDFISQRYDTLLFGVGDSKEYMGQFTHPYAFDLSLRTPDSSQTVWLVRFGLIGSIVNYLPFLYLFSLVCVKKRNSIRKAAYGVLPIITLLLISFLDPIFHDFKISIVSSAVYIYVLMNLETAEEVKNEKSFNGGAVA